MTPPKTLTRPSQIVARSNNDDEDDGIQKDPRTKRPKVWVPEKQKLMLYTRTTTYIDCLDDKTNLQRWGKRLVLVGATRAINLVDQARGLDPEDAGDKKKLDGLAEKVFAIAGGNDKRERGSLSHWLSEYRDREEELEFGLSDADRADMTAYRVATRMLQPKHIERRIVLDELKITGTPDRVSWYEGPGPDGCHLACHLITDLKTGNVEYGGLKMAMQLAIYSRGTFYDWRTQTRTPLPEDINQKWGMIVHLPVGSGTCTVYWIDLEVGWEGVQLATQVRKIRNTGKRVLTPFQYVTQDTAAQLV